MPEPFFLPLSELILATARNVQAVLAGRSLTDSLSQTPTALRSATQALAFHSMRQLGLAQGIRQHMVRRAPEDPLFDAVIMVSVCLLETAMAAEQRRKKGQRVPSDWPVYDAHTVVNQAVVAVASQRKMHMFKGLLNGVLRRYGREREEVLSAVLKVPKARWNHPDWWIRRMRKAYPDHWQSILQCANVPAPMTLRVNVRKISVSGFVQLLKDKGILVRLAGAAGVVLEAPRPVDQIPGFERGLFSVQDEAAQQAALLLEPENGMRVLDACAAPGGKTAHLLELADIELYALDSDAKRLLRVQDNLQRLGLLSEQVALKCADASNLTGWWDGQPFDLVLADVPCTASGVVRRHPDIRWLRREADIARTCALQQRILNALWKTVRPGGRLLYVTCSLFPEEGVMQARHFLASHADAQALPSPGQLLPECDDEKGGLRDGFFYALFAKPA